MTVHMSLAEAVQSLYPGTQVTIGPSIENGFYYDFARKEPFTIADLPKIRKKNSMILLIRVKNLQGKSGQEMKLLNFLITKVKNIKLS